MSLYTDIEHALISVSGSPGEGIRAEFNFPAGLELFKGHFPGTPILPGIAQIELVKFTLEAVFKRPLAIRSVKKTKFSSLIEPDAPVIVEIHLPAPKEGEAGLISARAKIRTRDRAAGLINLVLEG